MARFGLSSSDEEDDQDDLVQQQHQASPTASSRSPSPPPVTSLAGSRSRRDRSFDTDGSEEERMDDEDEEELTEDGTVNFSSRRGTSRLSSGSSQSSPPLRRRPLSTSALGPKPRNDDPTPWAKTLGLQPKRVAVMQASFFHQQPPSAPTALREQANPAPRSESSAPTKRPGDMLMNSTANPRDTNALSSSLPSTSSLSAPRPGFSVPQPAPPLPATSANLHSASTPLLASVALNKEGLFVDAGLALGRSLRVGWGPEGDIVSLDKSRAASWDHKMSIGTDEIKVNRLRFTLDPTIALDPTPVLQLQMAHTLIDVDPVSNIPSASPSLTLRFHHFSSLVAISPPVTPANISPEAQTSHRHAVEAEEQLWKLGEALFDEIEDLHLAQLRPEDVEGRQRVIDIRRRYRVEKWLGEVVKREVEEDLRSLASSSGAHKTTSGADRIFTLLTGHQVVRACSSASSSSDLRLATLIAQASAGGAIDEEFRSDIYLQLVKWREYGVEEWVSTGVRKVYSLLCGEVTGQTVEASIGRGESEAERIHVMQGLDWKRAFGLHLWYGAGGSGPDASLEHAVERYESAAKEDSVVARPSPSYCISTSTTAAPIPVYTDELPTDPLFHLLKIFTSSTHSLESFLLPTNFGPSSIDYRLPWTLYLLFSRVFRRRDFEDRTVVDQDEMLELMNGQDEIAPEGNSVRADMVTESYASQLEATGKWTWAVFVLLHLELAEQRVKSIRELIARHVNLIDDEAYTFLVDNLKLPPSWIYSAQATAAKYNNDPFLQFQLLLAAGDQNPAHEIVVRELAPEAVIRNDMTLLRRLLEGFEERAVEAWEDGGKVFLDYADCIQGLQAESPQLNHFEPVLLRLIKAVPRLVDQGGAGMKLQVCIEEMQSRLIAISSMLYQHSNIIKPAGLQEADRILWVQGANKTFLENSLAAALSSLA